ncbi:MAG TPA: VTT domain-containing protein, partial [Candidatus Nanoarchaeia archaeon]|nr:VTT domain-containing protein [Candidatus Nanoarchaeia archaeon]
MTFLNSVIDILLHLDKHLAVIIQSYGLLTYLLLFFVILIETGLVITPYLPGDSLLFAAGSLASVGSLNIFLLLIVLTTAAILGDSLNYFIGYHFGEAVFLKSKFYHPEYLQKAQDFYHKYGRKTLILARFVPIVRTFAPFVAGMGKMKYSSFLINNIIGGIIWVFLFVLAGYFLGGLS